MPGFRRVRKLSSWRRISLSAWERPSDPTVYGWLDIDVSRALAYLEALSRDTSSKVTLTHLVGKALALAIAEHPDVNGIVRRGRHIYTRSTVDIFFQVAYESGGNLSGAKVSRADEKPLDEIAAELTGRARAIRSHDSHELSRSDASLGGVPPVLRKLALRAIETVTYDWGLDLSKLGVPNDGFGSAMVTNVGMFGLQHGFAPLVPFSRVPIVLTVGAVRDAAVVEQGEVIVRPVLSVGVTLDHRVLDGFQAGKLAQRFCDVMRDPAAVLARGQSVD
jgi:pyruvate/2-oxoglutarate dehydrogenase complex dihydrolipoamide acyltransferase (E2) component